MMTQILQILTTKFRKYFTINIFGSFQQLVPTDRYSAEEAKK